MRRMIGVVVTASSLLLGVTESRHAMFSKYRTVEAYEVRPGILMMPTYSEDGRVCEIGLERRHYSPDKVVLDSGLSRSEIDQIIDELVPIRERGPKSENLLERGGIILEGNSLVKSEGYENVTIRMYREASSPSSSHGIAASDVAVTITWNHRKCRRVVHP